MEPLIHPDVWWSAASIAKYAERSIKTVEAKWLCDPTFPKPQRHWDGAHPRWKAGPVMEWIDKQGAPPSPERPHSSNDEGNLGPDARQRGQGPEAEAA